jgi:hypothetical protein
MATYNSVLNRIFTKSVLLGILSDAEDCLLSNVKNEFFPNNTIKTYNDFFNVIFLYLKSSYRNEYYYKNTMLNKLIINRHRINTTTAISEIPVNRSIADFVLINGNAQVYEIKTELDNIERLEAQIADYYKAFNYVNVITCKKYIDKIQSIINPKVGLHVINSRGSISTISEPIEDGSNLDLLTIFKIMSKKEFEGIIKLKRDLPIINQFEYYDTCFKILKSFEFDWLYNEFLKQLKARKTIYNQALLEKIPESLRFVVYFSNFCKNDFDKLNILLNKEF